MSESSLMTSIPEESTGCNDTLLIPLVAASWNVSAVNNNPFEYWITYPDPAYNDLMCGVQEFIDDDEQDVAISEIFTDSMFMDLCFELDSHSIAGVAELHKFWTQDYRSRKAVAGFLKNPEVGVKRLASLPDRITNTIYLAGGGVCLRPTVINAYDAPMPSMQAWWAQWRDFIFRTKVQVVPPVHCLARDGRAMTAQRRTRSSPARDRRSSRR